MDSSAVAVLGVGTVTALGDDFSKTWEALLQGRCGVRLEQLGGSTLHVALASSQDVAKIASMAVTEALEQANQLIGQSSLAQPRELALVLASSGGPSSFVTRASGHCGSYGADPVGHSSRPLLALLAEHSRANGPIMAVDTACSSGIAAVSVAVELLRSGRASQVLVCGAEIVTPVGAVGFSRMGAYAEAPCAPFASSRGMNLGEGAAAIVLGTEKDLPAGLEPLAWISGCAISSDAYHDTTPEPTGRALEVAIRGAVSASSFCATDIGYVNAHGTGTAANDAVELSVLQRIALAEQADWAVSSVKGGLGHTLGVSGLIELAVTVRALQTGQIPPTTNGGGLPTHDVDGLTVVGDQAQERAMRAALSINSGLGGVNGAIVVTCERRPAVSMTEPDHRVGVIAGGIAEHLYELRPGRISGREWRRLDALTRVALGSALLVDEAVNDVAMPDRSRVALCFATEHGPVESYAELASGRRMNPVVFPRLTMTWAMTTLGRLLSIKGPSVVYHGGTMGTIEMLAYGRSLVAREVADVVLVVAAEAPLTPIGEVDWSAASSAAVVLGPVELGRGREIVVGSTTSPPNGPGLSQAVGEFANEGPQMRQPDTSQHGASVLASLVRAMRSSASENFTLVVQDEHRRGLIRLGDVQ